MHNEDIMKLVIYILVLTLFGYSDCQWVQTNKTTFCDNVALCARHSNNLTLPVVDGHSLPQNDGLTICEHTTECGNSTDSPSEFISKNSDIMENSAKTRYIIHGNESIFCSALSTCNDSANTETYQDEDAFKYLQNMTHLCPYADHCALNALMTVTDDWTASCCSSCSCSPDCGKNRECCFESQDNYNIVDTEKMACIEMGLSFGKTGFYMIDKCPDDPECYKPGNILEPVSSRTAKRIYINMKCAQCNTGFNESAFIRWKMALGSQGFTDETFKNCMNNRQQCTAMYKIPALHWVWVMRFACGLFFRASCPRTEKGSKTPEIAEACSSIHAPVMKHSHYSYIARNIFCTLCIESELERYKPTKLCPLEPDDSIKGVASSMSMLLDSEVFYAKQVDVCLEQDGRQNGSCRLIFCPDWMFRIDGKCVYYTKRWFDTAMRQQFVLTPIKPMAAATFLNMTKEDRFRVDTWLFNDCNLPLDVDTIYHKYKLYMLPTRSGNESIVQEFYRRMWAVYSSLTPKTYFPAIKACVERRWRIVRDGTTYHLSASLYPYQTFMPDGKTKRPHVSLNSSYSEAPLPRVYEPISISKKAFEQAIEDRYYVLSYSPKHIVVTKLAYCERVRLSLDEVDLLYGQIRMKKNSKVLNDGEFSVEYDTVKGEKTPAFIKVCVEDYLYTNGTDTSSSNGQSGIGIIYVMLVAGMTGVL